MEPWVQSLITIVVTVIASSGFWAYIQSRSDRKSAVTQLLLALAHNEIVTTGMAYIERGWITKDEYEDFFKYLYGPYSHFGGNGLAEKVMNDVKTLPIRSVSVKAEVKIRNGEQNVTDQVPVVERDVRRPESDR